MLRKKKYRSLESESSIQVLIPRFHRTSPAKAGKKFSFDFLF